MKLYDVITKESKSRKANNVTVSQIAPVEYDEPSKQSRTPSTLHTLLIILGAVTFLAGLYIVGMKLVHAQVVVVERRIPYQLVDTEFELTHEKVADEGRLSFQAMVVTSEVSREVFGSELRQSTSKAKGKAVLFNEYSKTSQTIKAGTTLTSTDGKRYTTQSTVVIPGWTGTTAKKTPGTVTVGIVAADVGPQFNAESASFGITGWTGTRAKQLYGRSAGAISGGEAGMRHMLSETEREATLTTLTAALTERLKRETRAQIPPELITFPELQVITIDNESLVIDGETVKFPARLKGTMVSYLIPRELLEQAIAAKALRDRTLTRVSIPNLVDISVSPRSALPTSTTDIPESITISIDAEGVLIAKVSNDRITERLLGIKRGLFESVLTDMSQIDTATFTLYPFWAPFFPTESSDIELIIK